MVTCSKKLFCSTYRLTRLILSFLDSGDDGLVVSMLAFCFNYPDLNPAKVYSFFLQNFVWNERKINKKRSELASLLNIEYFLEI